MEFSLILSNILNPPVLFFLVRLFADKQNSNTETVEQISWVEVLREACLNGSVFLLVSSLIIGLINDCSKSEKRKKTDISNF